MTVVVVFRKISWWLTSSGEGDAACNSFHSLMTRDVLQC